jgi:uncharacterized protein (UPF0335 family)
MAAATAQKQPILATEVGGVSGAKLKNFIERIERMEEEKAGIATDIKETFAEAKGFGFDTKVMRTVLKIRKQDQDARREQEELLELYKSALGMPD